MYKRRMLFVLLLGVFLCGARPVTAAQGAEAASKPPATKPAVAYRLDFSINELEDGRKLNTRHYSMNLMGERKELKIGTRVPILTEGKVDYLDIGTFITAHLETSEPPIVLDVSAEISSFANEGTTSGPPLVRQARIGASTVVILDKPMVVGSVDDPNSKRQFQLEVLATKLQ